MFISKKDKNISSGFTMIEILVVMVVIGIVGTIVFVALGKQRQKARVNKAVSTVKSAMSITITCKSFDGTVNAPKGEEENPICSGSSQTPEGNWPALTDGCQYCGLSSDIVKFNCSGECQEDGGEADSFCNVSDGRCEQKN